MHRVILHAGLLLVALAGIAGGTAAFYSDSETATANTFAAGALDLEVDHQLASYNGTPCKQTCTVAEGSDLVTNGSFEQPEVDTSQGWDLASDSDTGWRTSWLSGPDTYEGTSQPETPKLELHRNASGWQHAAGSQHTELDADWDGPGGSLNGEPAQIAISQQLNTQAGQVYELRFAFAARPNTGTEDNALNVEVIGESGTLVSKTKTRADSDAGVEWQQYTLRFTADASSTTLRFADVSSENDSEGVFLDDVRVLQTSCSSSFAGAVGTSSCRLFQEARDLSGEQFFTLTDVKPGDNGQHQFSLHLSNNPGYACMLVHNGIDKENTRTEVEQAAGDTSANAGELRESIEILGWLDENGDGSLDAGESATNPQSLAAVTDSAAALPIADSTYGDAALSATSTHLYQFAWCVGSLSVDSETGTISCDGSAASNQSQTDSLAADLTLYAAQERNNEQFSCSEVPADTLDEAEAE